VRYLPVGWSVAEVAVNNGRSVLTLDHDRAGAAALVVRLSAGCDPVGAVELGEAEVDDQVIDDGLGHHPPPVARRAGPPRRQAGQPAGP
jgi:hypothetical protein